MLAMCGHSLLLLSIRVHLNFTPYERWSVVLEKWFIRSSAPYACAAIAFAAFVAVCVVRRRADDVRHESVYIGAACTLIVTWVLYWCVIDWWV